MAPKFLKKVAVALKFREDSLAVLEQGLGDAGLGDADLASLDEKQLEKLRAVVMKTETGDAIAVFQDRVGTEFLPDERKILTRIAEIAIKRSGRLPGLVATLRKEGADKQAQDMADLRQQVAGSNDALARMQATMDRFLAMEAQKMELEQRAREMAAQQQPAPAPAPANPPAPAPAPANANPPAGA